MGTLHIPVHPKAFSFKPRTKVRLIDNYRTPFFFSIQRISDGKFLRDPYTWTTEQSSAHNPYMIRTPYLKWFELTGPYHVKVVEDNRKESKGPGGPWGPVKL